MKRAEQVVNGVLVTVVAVVAAACGGGLQVQSDYDPVTDFSQYSTFVVQDTG